MIQKQLGQTQTGAGTETTIYTVPSNTEASNLILTCCNVTASADTIQVYQDDNGASSTSAEALYFDLPIAAKATLKLAIGPMSTATGTIRVSSATANAVTFTLHGMERIR